MIGGTATLEGLLADAGQSMDNPAMRWMVLTWDLAVINSDHNKYYRFLVVDKASLSLYGRRSVRTFASGDPSRGTVGKLTAGNVPLNTALLKSDDKTKEGYSLVCKPLAVDCSAYASRVERPVGLLQAIKDSSDLGSRVLATVNLARADVVSTHLDRQWSYNFPRVAVEDLWLGR